MRKLITDTFAHASVEAEPYVAQRSPPAVDQGRVATAVRNHRGYARFKLAAQPLELADATVQIKVAYNTADGTPSDADLLRYVRDEFPKMVVVSGDHRPGVVTLLIKRGDDNLMRPIDDGDTLSGEEIEGTGKIAAEGDDQPGWRALQRQQEEQQQRRQTEVEDKFKTLPPSESKITDQPRTEVTPAEEATRPQMDDDPSFHTVYEEKSDVPSLAEHGLDTVNVQEDDRGLVELVQYKSHDGFVRVNATRTWDRSKRPFKKLWKIVVLRGIPPESALARNENIRNQSMFMEHSDSFEFASLQKGLTSGRVSRAINVAFEVESAVVKIQDDIRGRATVDKMFPPRLKPDEPSSVSELMSRYTPPGQTGGLTEEASEILNDAKGSMAQANLRVTEMLQKGKISDIKAQNLKEKIRELALAKTKAKPQPGFSEGKYISPEDKARIKQIQDEIKQLEQKSLSRPVEIQRDMPWVPQAPGVSPGTQLKIKQLKDELRSITEKPAKPPSAEMSRIKSDEIAKELSRRLSEVGGSSGLAFTRIGDDVAHGHIPHTMGEALKARILKNDARKLIDANGSAKAALQKLEAGLISYKTKNEKGEEVMVRMNPHPAYTSALRANLRKRIKEEERPTSTVPMEQALEEPESALRPEPTSKHIQDYSEPGGIGHKKGVVIKMSQAAPPPPPPGGAAPGGAPTPGAAPPAPPGGDEDLLGFLPPDEGGEEAPGGPGGPEDGPGGPGEGDSVNDVSLTDALQDAQESLDAIREQVEGGGAIIDGQEVEAVPEAPASSAAPVPRPPAAAQPITAHLKTAEPPDDKKPKDWRENIPDFVRKRVEEQVRSRLPSAVRPPPAPSPAPAPAKPKPPPDPSATVDMGALIPKRLQIPQAEAPFSIIRKFFEQHGVTNDDLTDDKTAPPGGKRRTSEEKLMAKVPRAARDAMLHALNNIDRRNWGNVPEGRELTDVVNSFIKKLMAISEMEDKQVLREVSWGEGTTGFGATPGKEKDLAYDEHKPKIVLREGLDVNELTAQELADRGFIPKNYAQESTYSHPKEPLFKWLDDLAQAPVENVPDKKKITMGTGNRVRSKEVMQDVVTALRALPRELSWVKELVSANLAGDVDIKGYEPGSTVPIHEFQNVETGEGARVREQREITPRRRFYLAPARNIGLNIPDPKIYDRAYMDTEDTPNGEVHVLKRRDNNEVLLKAPTRSRLEQAIAIKFPHPRASHLSKVVPHDPRVNEFAHVVRLDDGTCELRGLRDNRLYIQAQDEIDLIEQMGRKFPHPNAKRPIGLYHWDRLHPDELNAVAHAMSAAVQAKRRRDALMAGGGRGAMRHDAAKPGAYTDDEIEKLIQREERPEPEVNKDEVLFPKTKAREDAERRIKEIHEAPQPITPEQGQELELQQGRIQPQLEQKARQLMADLKQFASLPDEQQTLRYAQPLIDTMADLDNAIKALPEHMLAKVKSLASRGIPKMFADYARKLPAERDIADIYAIISEVDHWHEALWEAYNIARPSRTEVQKERLENIIPENLLSDLPPGMALPTALEQLVPQQQQGPKSDPMAKKPTLMQRPRYNVEQVTEAEAVDPATGQVKPGYKKIDNKDFFYYKMVTQDPKKGPERVRVEPKEALMPDGKTTKPGYTRAEAPGSRAVYYRVVETGQNKGPLYKTVMAPKGPSKRPGGQPIVRKPKKEGTDKSAVDDEAAEYWEDYMDGYGRQMVEDPKRRISTRTAFIMKIAEEMGVEPTERQVIAIVETLENRPPMDGAFVLWAAQGGEPSVDEMVNMALEKAQGDSTVMKAIDRLIGTWMLRAQIAQPMSPEQQRRLLMQAISHDSSLRSRFRRLFRKTLGQQPTMDPMEPGRPEAMDAAVQLTAAKFKMPKIEKNNKDNVKGVMSLDDVVEDMDIAPAGHICFTHDHPITSGAYTYLAVNWAPEDVNVSDASLHQAIKNYVKGLESQRNCNHDFGYIGVITIEEIDSKAGNATVKFRAKKQIGPTEVVQA